MPSDQAPISPLAPEVSPLAEADPNSINEFIQERVDAVFNTPPPLLTDSQLKVAVEYYRRERQRFLLESQQKPPRASGPRKKAPTSVQDAIDSSSDLF